MPGGFKSMSIEDVRPEELARLFHQYHGMLTHAQCRQEDGAWEQAPARERNRMVAAARLAIDELAMRSQPEPKVRFGFANPGEAEWGC
jgi:hypothetical protein